MNDDIITELTVGSEPHSPLTTLCALMTDALAEALEQEERATGKEHDVRGIVFLNDEEHGGIQMFGYEDTGAGLADLLVHLKAMFSSMGKGFGVMTGNGEMIINPEPSGGDHAQPPAPGSS